MKTTYVRAGITALGLAFAGTAAHAQTISASNPFTAGDLVVSQINDNTTNPTFGFSVTLDEFTTSGSAVASLNLPTSVSGGNNAIFVTSHSGEGLLTLSGNSQYLTIAGYSLATTTSKPDPSTATSASDPRTVATIDPNGVINTTTLLTAADTKNNIRTAYTTNGTNLYTGGAGGGLYNTTVGTTNGSETQINANNVRDIRVDNSNLYLTSTTTNFVGVSVITALPTSSTAPTLIASTTSDSNPDGLYVTPGAGTIWVADNGATTPGLYEYTKSGNTYTAANSGNPFTSGLTAGTLLTGLTGDSTDLFATAALSGVYSLVDYNIASGSFTTLATAPTGDEFQGVDFAPTPNASGTSAAPEPSQYAGLTFFLLGLTGLAFRARKRASAAAAAV